MQLSPAFDPTPLRQHLGMTQIDRAGLEIFGDVLKILRHPQQCPSDLSLVH